LNAAIVRAALDRFEADMGTALVTLRTGLQVATIDEPPPSSPVARVPLSSRPSHPTPGEEANEAWDVVDVDGAVLESFPNEAAARRGVRIMAGHGITATIRRGRT
jgi:hypothetical protein